jgi:hypothetical protein
MNQVKDKTTAIPPRPRVPDNVCVAAALLLTSPSGRADQPHRQACFTPGEDCTGLLVDEIASAHRSILVQAKTGSVWVAASCAGASTNDAPSPSAPGALRRALGDPPCAPRSSAAGMDCSPRGTASEEGVHHALSAGYRTAAARSEIPLAVTTS